MNNDKNDTYKSITPPFMSWSNFKTDWFTTIPFIIVTIYVSKKNKLFMSQIP